MTASEAPEAVVRRHVEAFNARDLETLLGCFGDDADWVTGTGARLRTATTGRRAHAGIETTCWIMPPSIT